MKTDTGQSQILNKSRSSELLHTTLFLVIALCFVPIIIASSEEVQVFNENESRSRIVMVNGHIYVHAGAGRNISFKAGKTGAILLEDTDIRLYPKLSDFNDAMTRLRSQEESITVIESFVGIVKQELQVIKDERSKFQEKVADIVKLHSRSIRNIINNTIMRRVRSLITPLRRRITNIERQLLQDNCAVVPCKNGGTCISLYKKYVCLCQDGYEGLDCSWRTNYCALIANSGSGCQNGGTCIDLNTGFACLCPRGFHGHVCQTKATSCEADPELCGAMGHCLPAVNSQAGYKCICEWGYRSSNNTDNPVCEDVDECLSTNPCYPGSTCINLPGSFKCAGCPPGLTGNGIFCNDIDECSDPNLNDCSKEPPVSCINTIGSYLCQSCPPGYKGDGRFCVLNSPCNPSPCHSSATCYEAETTALRPLGYICICPRGFSGNGIGSEGCFISNETFCQQYTCLNGGQCIVLENNTYRCACADGFTGKRCQESDDCTATSCNLRGLCRNNHCFCFSSFYGKNCEFEAIGDCVRFETELAGTISYTGPYDSPCRWYIKTYQPKSVIEVSVTEFTLSTQVFSSRSCDKTSANLIIHDGPIEGYPMGLFCNDQKNAPSPEVIMRSSSDEVTIKYEENDLTRAKANFTIKWNTVPRSCGGRLAEDRGEISLYHYPENAICQWHVYAKPGKVLTMQLRSLKLASGEIHNCTINSLEFYYGLVVDKKFLIRQLCNSATNAFSIESILPYVTVYFKSNYPGTFQNAATCKPPSQCSREVFLWYDQVPVREDCGGTIKLDATANFSGSVVSPNFGFSYPSNLRCFWLLDASSSSVVQNDDFVIKIEIESLDVPSSVGQPKTEFCSSDSVAFYDGDDISKPQMGQFCNEHYPTAPLVSSGSKVLIVFSSDAHKSGTGFKVNYFSTCEKHFTAMNGTISTWNFPDGSDRPLKCTYVIDAVRTHAIKLKFVSINMDIDYLDCSKIIRGEKSSDDYIEFSGGHYSHSLMNRRYYCPSFPFFENSEMVISATRPLKIIYSTAEKKNKGVVLTYEQFDVGCGGIFEGEEGVITSPNFPESYLSHMHCIYVITVLPGKIIRINFDVFALEVVANDNDCNMDSVRIYDTYVNDNEKGKLYGQFCGAMIPPPLVSDGNTLTVVFLSDRSIGGDGFSAHWEAVDAQTYCHRTYTASSGNFTIGVDGSSFKYVTCDYTIALTTSGQIRLRITNFTSPCNVGTLMIRDGINEESPGFSGLYGDSEVCDDYPATDFRSHGNRIFMRFTTKKPQLSKFVIYYEQLSSDCGGRVSGISGSISAPQYPLKDSRTLYCSWVVSVAPGNQIRFTLQKLDDLKSADMYGFCGRLSSSYLDILDGASTSAKILRRYCKKEDSLNPLTSDGYELLVIYKQNFAVGGLFGFLAHFYTACQDIVLTDHHGILQSPGYPDNVFQTRNCRWKIQARQGNKLRLTFHLFRIWHVDKRVFGLCYMNFLEFGKGQIESVTTTNSSSNAGVDKAGRYCNEMSVPQIVLSKRNVIDVTFSSNERPDNHFWLSWTTVGCGGTLLQEKEIFVNASELDSDSNMFECAWVIKAPVGKRVNFFIEDFLVFNNIPNCAVDAGTSFEGLAFYAGTNNNSGIIQKAYCSKKEDENVIFSSDTNEIFALLRVSRKYVASRDIFFKASVSFIPPDNLECGTVINVDLTSPANVHSPNFPKAPPKFMACNWLINAPAHHFLRFNLTFYKTLNYHPRKQTHQVQNWNMSPSKISCRDSVVFFEEQLSFYDGNTTFGQLIERFCQSIEGYQVVDTSSSQVLLTFDGAPYERSYASGEDEQKNKIGFVLSISVKCGGKFYADGMLRSVQFRSFLHENCTYVIQASEPSEHIFMRIDLLEFRHHSYGTTVTVFDAKKSEVLGSFGSSCHAWRSPSENSCARREFVSSGDSMTIEISGLDVVDVEQLHFSYSSQLQACGGHLKGIQGNLVSLRPLGDLECEWDIETAAGNTVSFEIQTLVLSDSEHCAVSFLEIRENDFGGRILKRICGSETNNVLPYKLSGRSLFIRFRYRKENDTDNANTNVIFKAHFDKVFGGLLSHAERRISSPSQDDWKLLSYRSIEWRLVAEVDHWIRIRIETIEIPVQQTVNIDFADRRRVNGLIFNEGLCSPTQAASCGPIVFIFSGYTPPNEFVIRSQQATVLFRAVPGSSFSLQWEQIPTVSLRTTTSATSVSPGNESSLESNAMELSAFNCGTTLIPQVSAQYIVSPGSLESDGSFTTVGFIQPDYHYPKYERPGGYRNDLRCRWTIRRPMFSGIVFRIVSLDLESHMECKYDYLAISSVDFSSPEDIANLLPEQRYCHHNKVGFKRVFTSGDYIYVYFITDSTQNGKGFVLEYKLTCQSFDYIPRSFGLLDKVLYSPNYPSNYDSNLTCEWSIVLHSSRPILANFTDMDIEVADDCKKDFIIVEGRPLVSQDYVRVCGKEVGWNKKLENGRIFIRFQTNAEGTNKGFALHLREEVFDCSSDMLVLSEGDQPKTISSPNFPGPSPHSVNCHWLINAPSGHRIKFTVDPRTYQISSHSFQRKSSCRQDYLEIYDGPSTESPLIGTYCDEPPSTIYSSGSYLFVVFVTDPVLRSAGFNATYEIASCGGTLVLSQEDAALLKSPNFPAPYPSKTECDWNVVVPSTHFVNASFDHLSLYYSTQCVLDSISLWEGYQFEKNETILPPACVQDDVSGHYYTSARNMMHVKFRSNNTLKDSAGMFCFKRKCGFQMVLKSSKLGCGGEITDDEGTIESPGYPGKIIEDIVCDWFFSAGIGSVYLLEIRFPEKDNFFLSRTSKCYPDVYVSNGLVKKDFLSGISHHFCANSTKIVSSADLIRVTYDDRMSTLHKRWGIEFGMSNENMYSPFSIYYTKMPKGELSCFYQVSKNSSVEVNLTRPELEGVVNFHDFCRISVEKPDTHGTLILHFSIPSRKNPLISGFYKGCYDFDDNIDISAKTYEPWPVEKRICSAIIGPTREYIEILTHSRLDIYVYRAPQSAANFNLSVTFYECGGNIYGPESGVIVSPGYDNVNSTYPANIDCLWTLNAPEGHVVKVNITEMQMPFHYRCENDYLALHEGAGTNTSEIHRYCNNEDVQERFKESIGRVLTFHFHSGSSPAGKGFKIHYSFHGSDTVCGFTTKQMNGTLTSPKSPNDYPNNAYCVWDISVPTGYHVRLNFSRLAIQKSNDCQADYLKIMQEHQSRGVSPLSDYYFYYDRSALIKTFCGYEAHEVVESESNRIRLEFQSDSNITDKGFIVNWNAACGTIFRLSHGIITSPHYPEFYPDDNFECVYKIIPAYDGIPIILLKLLVFELSPLRIDFEREPCQTDFLEIRELNTSSVIRTFCASLDISSEFEPISVKGPIAVRFVVNATNLQDNAAKKLYRGFKLSYALSKCGGAISLKDVDGERSKEITSPGYPLPYHHDLDCVWNVSARDSDVISVKFANLKIEASLSCVHDYVELSEPAINGTKSLGRFCDYDAPSDIVVTSGSNLIIRFVTDYNLNDAGPAGGCGGDLVAAGGTELKSPTDPKTGLYYNNLRCGWTIRTDIGKVIEIQIKELKLQPSIENSSECSDFLTIYDGYKKSSPLLMTNTCSLETVPLVLRSSHRILYIYFETDSDIASDGFLLQYKSEMAVCGGRQEAVSDPQELKFESEKGLTRTLAKELRCRWYIYSSHKMPLRFKFSEFSFPFKTKGCGDAYVEIRDVGTTADCQHPACANEGESSQTVKHCGTDIPADFVSRTSIVQVTAVTFIQSEQTAKFAFKYQTLDSCNRSIDAEEKTGGRITSPNYPNNYGFNTECLTLLKAPYGCRILLVFKDFNLERESAAPLNYPTWPMNRNHHNYGLTPHYPRKKKGRYTTFFPYRNPMGRTCDYDFITDTDGSMTRKYCHSNIPPTFFSSGNSLQLHLHSDFNVNEKGYDAYYYVTCPNSINEEDKPTKFFDFGEIREMQGVITNVGYPSGYPMNQKMKWLINPPTGHKCKLTLVEMNFGTNRDGLCTSGDRILMSENVKTSTVIASYYLPCREATTYPHDIPMQVGAYVSLFFESDNNTSNDGSGFRIQYSCDNIVY